MPEPTLSPGPSAPKARAPKPIDIAVAVAAKSKSALLPIEERRLLKNWKRDLTAAPKASCSQVPKLPIVLEQMYRDFLRGVEPKTLRMTYRGTHRALKIREVNAAILYVARSRERAIARLQIQLRRAA